MPDGTAELSVDAEHANGAQNAVGCATAEQTPEPLAIARQIRAIRRIEALLFSPKTSRQTTFCLTFWAAVLAIIIVIIVFWPKLVDDVIEPSIKAVEGKVARGGLVVIILLCLALFPLVFLTVTPIMWLAAFAFSFGTALAICAAGRFLGMLLPFLAARTLLARRLAAWRPFFPKVDGLLKAASSAGGARVVVLFRLGPVPDSLASYACGLIDGLGIFVYCVASNLANFPFLVAAVYFGRSLKGFADLLRGKHLSPGELLLLVGSVVASVVLGLGGYYFFRRELRRINAECAMTEPPQLEPELASPRLETDSAMQPSSCPEVDAERSSTGGSTPDAVRLNEGSSVQASSQ